MNSRVLGFIALSLGIGITACNSDGSKNSGAPLAPQCSSDFIDKLNQAENSIGDALDDQNPDKAEQVFSDFNKTYSIDICSAYSSGSSKSPTNVVISDEIKKWREWIDKTRAKVAAKPSKRFDPPSFADAYEPHTKNVSSPGNTNEVTAETNLVANYFGYKRYEVISRTGFSNDSTENWKQIESQTNFANGGNSLTVFLKGEKHLSLPFLPGLEFVAPDPTVAKITTNGFSYVLQWSDKDLKSIQIGLRNQSNARLPVELRNRLTREVVDLKEFPPKIKDLIAANEKSEPQVAANNIRYFISTQFLYSSGSRPEKDLLSAVTVGSFQCDMAAYLMVALLRKLKIPSRVVVGYQGLKNSTTGSSYLSTQQDGHAWVEVFVEGSGWATYDPTPTTMDRQTPEIERMPRSYRCAKACGSED